ncbi:MAG: transglutaminase-like domain-containing protein [Chitinophagales bacterium]|nr:transglutaminase family protein [Bacteroidota bacterium]MCB9225978.1 hypothetical protein [Chitinophagales bacterium]
MNNHSEIQALISLLDDEDEEIIENVSNKLISYGKPILATLEEAWGCQDYSALHFEKIEKIIAKIHFDDIYQQLNIWLKDDFATLIDGALIIAQLFYHDLDKDKFNEELAKQKQKIWLELNNNYTALENINIFNQVFYNVLGYKGVKTKEFQYNHFCVNNVLDTRQGAPIALGILYISLAQQLDLPVYGVNLYKHFVLAYQKNFVYDFTQENSSETIFYMNPSNKGVSFFKKEILSYLASSKVEPKTVYFEPASPFAIIKELLRYLYYTHVAQNDESKVHQIKLLVQLFD